jgi:ABC-type sugar transport system substrate-binding protein
MKRLPVFVLLLMVSGLLAACGSSGGSSSSETGETGGSTAPASSSESSGSSESGGSSEAFVTAEEAESMEEVTGLEPLSAVPTAEELKERVAQFEATPEKLLIDEPVSKKAESGKTIAWMTCGVPVCEEIEKAGAEAASKLGWKVEKIDLGVSPEDFANAYTRVVGLKPDLVVGSGLSRELFNTQLEELKEEGVPVLMYAGPDEPGNGITGNILAKYSYYSRGMITAEAIAADSELKGQAVMFNVTQYAGSTVYAETIENYLPKICPECTLNTEDEQVTQVGKMGATVTGYVQAHPEIKYVICTFGDLCQGVGQALKAAGSDEVKILSTDPSTISYENIAAGLEYGTIPLPNGQTGWQIVDAAQRIFNKQSLEPTRNYPQQLVTEVSNAKSPLIGAVPSYQAEYEKLWLLN